MITIVSMIMLPLTTIITWENMAELNDALRVYDLVIGGDGCLYAGASINSATSDRGRVFVSNDLWNWQECAGVPWVYPDTINGVYALINGVNDTLFAGIGLYHNYDAPRVFKSSDGGATWIPLNGYGDFRVGSRVCALFEDNLGYLHLGNNWGGMWAAIPRRSTDRGESWHVPDTLNSDLVYNSLHYCFCQSTDNTLYFGSWGGDGPHISTDNGWTWNHSPIIGGISDTYTVVEYGTDTILAGADADLYMTTDHGSSWTELGSGYFGSATAIRSLFVSSEGYIYAGTAPYAEVFVSVDRGDTWVSTGLLSGATTVYAFAEGMKSTESADRDSIFLFASTGPNGDVFRGLMYTVGTADRMPGQNTSQMLSVGPNPSAKTTQLHCTLPDQVQHACITIHDVLGREIKRFSLKRDSDSRYMRILWNNCDSSGARAPAGLYFITLDAGKVRETQTVIIIE